MKFLDTHAFDIALLFVSLVIAVRALTLDIFIDESDSPPSETADELRGVKATKGNRILLICISLAVAIYAIWTMVKR
jgi:hypothetical protein